jgi:hypothetical protein
MKAEYTRHGGAYDRGSADKYYGRDFNPHYFVGDSLASEYVLNLNSEERAAYTQGYNEQTDAKEWGDLL